MRYLLPLAIIMLASTFALVPLMAAAEYLPPLAQDEAPPPPADYTPSADYDPPAVNYHNKYCHGHAWHDCSQCRSHRGYHHGPCHHAGRHHKGCLRRLISKLSHRGGHHGGHHCGHH